MLSDPLLLAQSIKITNWLTPVWIMSLGIAIGFGLVILMLIKVHFMQRISGINSVTEKPGKRMAVSILTALAYLGLFVGFLYWRLGAEIFQGQVLVVPLLFAAPVCLILGFGVWTIMSRRMSGEIKGMVFEGFLSWMNKVCIAMTVFAILGFLLGPTSLKMFGKEIPVGAGNGFGIIKFVDDPNGVVRSLVRLPFTGVFSKEFKIEPSGDNHSGDVLPVAFDGAELQTIEFDSDRRLEVSTEPITPETPEARLLDIQSSESAPFRYFQRPDGRGRIPHGQIDSLYVNNLGRSTANLKLTWQTAPVYREVTLIPFVAIIVLSIYLFYLIFASLAPKVAAIAFSTFKTEVSQPLFSLVMILGVMFIVGTIYVPYNTFGEDIKMYKDSGLTLIRVLAIFMAIWAASKSVAEEIEGRTALTVLSKPVGRRQFVLGKFTGIALSVAVMFIVLGLWFYIWVAYKPIYDFQENSKGIAEWSQCFTEAVYIIPGLFLCFLEVLIFVAISVAISTRFGILANFLICFSIYVLGHLTPLLVQSSFAAFEPVVVFGRLVAIVFPVLNHFDVQAAINTNSLVPISYLAWAVIYTGLYGAMAMLLALVLFEDRDLA